MMNLFDVAIIEPFFYFGGWVLLALGIIFVVVLLICFIVKAVRRKNEKEFSILDEHENDKK